MTVSVKGETFEEFKWKETKGIYELENDASIIIMLDVNGVNNYYKFAFKKGFRCDGLSVPWCFQWFLKSWDKNNMLYNLAGVVHDAIYGNKGWNYFNREDADAIFRGLLRDAGCNRFHASLADFALGFAAKSHWGNDDLDSADLVTCEEI